MFKKLLTALTSITIAILIPAIVVLSGAQDASKKIDELKAQIPSTAQITSQVIQETEIIPDAPQTGGPIGKVFGGVTKVTKVAVKPVKKVAAPVVGAVVGAGSAIFADGSKNIDAQIKDTKDILNKATMGMYGGIGLLLFLVILLLILNTAGFFRNIGTALGLGGILSLGMTLFIYYFYILNYESTIQYFMNMSDSAALSIPVVAKLVKSLAKDFILYISNILVKRTAIVGGASIIGGIVSRFIQRFFGRN